ncbi:MAG: NYN domain-containing protein [Caldilineales bacterium]
MPFPRIADLIATMTLLIDGHNLIGALPGIELTDADDEWQLVTRLRSFAAARRQPVTVVFDSGVGPAPRWQFSDAWLTVRFAPAGTEADALLVQMVRAAARPREIIVVSNDRGLAAQVRAAGGQVRSATQFAAQLAPPRAAPRATASDPAWQADAPGFADLYRGFLRAEQDQARFGEDIALSAATWIERLYGDDLGDVERAARWLGRFGGSLAREPLLDALSHRVAPVRAAAALALGELGDRSTADALILRLQSDSSGLVREAAAQALGCLGGSAASAALQAAQSDSKNKVRKSASAALAHLRVRGNL